MEIEKTKFVVEVRDYEEVNDYLKLGWFLINHYVYDFGGENHPEQKVIYVLAWQKPESEPKHPENSSYLSNKKLVESMKSQYM